MNVTKTISDTLMNDEDKAHVELLAQRHNIDFLDYAFAAMLALKNQEENFSLTPTSFSCAGTEGGVKLYGLYLHKDEAQTPEEAYFIALHEIGHTVLRHHDTHARHEVQHEIEAWAWAVEHANYFPSDEVITGIILPSLSTYTDNREAEERPGSLLDMATPDFWKRHHIKTDAFIAAAREAHDQGRTQVVMGEFPNLVVVPMPFGYMLAEWIQEGKNDNEHNLIYGIEQLLSEFEKSKNPEFQQRAAKGRELFNDVLSAKNQLELELAA